MCVQMKEQIVLFALMSNFMQNYAGLSEKLKFLARADLATMANGSIVMSQNKNKTILKLIFFSHISGIICKVSLSLYPRQFWNQNQL